MATIMELKCRPFYCNACDRQTDTSKNMHNLISLHTSMLEGAVDHPEPGHRQKNKALCGSRVETQSELRAFYLFKSGNMYNTAYADGAHNCNVIDSTVMSNKGAPPVALPRTEYSTDPDSPTIGCCHVYLATTKEIHSPLDADF